MKVEITKLNWFYFAALLFAVSLPFSIALISISSGLLLFASLVQFNRDRILQTFPNRKVFLFTVGVYFIFVFWLVFTTDWKWAMYDLRKNIAFLIIPLAFLLAPALTNFQIRKVLYLFAISVLLSALITFCGYFLRQEHSILSAQKYGFIHHIRFSLQIIFAMVILVDYFILNKKRITVLLKAMIIGALIFLLIFLVWHQSLTGLITFFVISFVAILLFLSRLKSIRTRFILGGILLIIILFPTGYLYYAFNKFYDVDDIEPSKLEQYTKGGNEYKHSLTNKTLENGHYVGLYMCEKELEEEWNKRSSLKYKERDKFGHGVKYTLIRYLTSKSLRKDKEGVIALSKEDVVNIENGISNYILAEKNLVLYPRIYVSIWELDTYFKTGESNHKSLAQRIEYTKAAVDIIKKNFWLGVGTGNWKKEYRQFYEKNKVKMNPERYGNVHNQYLNYMVKFGLVGFLLILFAIFYPVLKLKAYQSSLFVFFLLIVFVGNLGDANLEDHAGSNFFAFFYCLLLTRFSK